MIRPFHPPYGSPYHLHPRQILIKVHFIVIWTDPPAIAMACMTPR
jgi:hypothetical protein